MASPLFTPGRFLTENPEPYTVVQTEAIPFVAVPEAVAAEKPTLIGAMDDQRPLQSSPSGKVREMPPVLPIIPSTVAVRTGSGCCFDSGHRLGIASPSWSRQPKIRPGQKRRIWFEASWLINSGSYVVTDVIQTQCKRITFPRCLSNALRKFNMRTERTGPALLGVYRRGWGSGKETKTTAKPVKDTPWRVLGSPNLFWYLFPLPKARRAGPRSTAKSGSGRAIV